MNLPDFLIIGAMKAGTTTLYHDLRVNPWVFMPAIKEPEALCDDAVLTEAGTRRYADLFDRARKGQLCGEASTSYTKLPDYPGVPERAQRLLGPDCRVIYIVRDPVARIISHHYHSYASGRFGPNVDEEVRREPSLLNYSRYAMQIQPWIETLGRDRVLVLVFEEFVAARRETARLVCEFLGIQPLDQTIRESMAYNRSDGKPTRSAFWRKLRRSRWYQRHVQPRLSVAFRERMRRLLLPSAPPRPDPPTESTKQFILEQLADDIEQLHYLLDRDEPIWAHFYAHGGTT